ncbi:50S ribosomal protein L31e [Candidatus Woesearchaeota archaeon]|nr:50S ribosomal protein L31e [Candidatus Woesearchaeota archaeon]
MAELERTFTIPLRKEWLKAPKYRRAKRTIAAVRDFLTQHMKPVELKLGTYLNLEIWKHGINNPPARIRVTAKKDDKGVVMAELFGAPVEKPKEEKKTAKKAEEKKAAVDEKKTEEKKVEITTPAVPTTPETKPEKKPAKPRTKKVTTEVTP